MHERIVLGDVRGAVCIDPLGGGWMACTAEGPDVFALFFLSFSRAF